MDKRLTFAAALTPRGLERDVAVHVDRHGMIAEISTGGPPYDGFVALPGMPNAHSHAFQRALAGRGEAARGSDSFWTWREEMYRLANTMDGADAYAVARMAFSEMLIGGFTHLVEFHYLLHAVDGSRGPEMTDAVVRAAADVGMPLTLLPVYYRTSGFDGTPAHEGQSRFVHDSVDDYLRTLTALRDSGRSGLHALGAAPHSLRAVPPSDLADLVAGVDDILGPRAPLHIHVSEQVGEVDESLVCHGATPIDLLFDHVEAGERWNLVHATHATPAEREAVRASATVVVLCPLTEAYLGDGIFEAREHATGGGTLAIGTDSNVRISAIEELRMLEYGQRLKDRMRARLGTEAGIGGPMWSRLAAGGARSAGVEAGSIATGRRADLIVMDEEGPSLLGHGPETAIDAWLVGGDARDLASVYVGGRRVVDHGEIEAGGDIRGEFGAVMRRLGAAPRG